MRSSSQDISVVIATIVNQMWKISVAFILRSSLNLMIPYAVQTSPLRKSTNISRLTLKPSTEHSHIAIHPTTLNRGTPSLLHRNKEPHACLPVRKLSTPCTNFLEAPSTITDLNMFVDGSTSKKKTCKLPRKLYYQRVEFTLKIQTAPRN